MCLDDAFRLCSCDADSLAAEEVGWILEAVDLSKPKNTKKGKMRVPEWARAELQTVDGILAQLNSRACFDFELDTTTQCRLQLRVTPADTTFADSKEWLLFLCQNGKWRHLQHLDKFAGYRTQLVPCKQGKIEPRAPAAAADTAEETHTSSSTQQGWLESSFARLAAPFRGGGSSARAVDKLVALAATQAEIEAALLKDGVAGRWVVALGTDQTLELELRAEGSCILRATCTEEAEAEDDEEDTDHREGHLRAKGTWKRDGLSVELKMQSAEEWGNQCDALPMRKEMLSVGDAMVGKLRWDAETFLVFRPHVPAMPEMEVLFSWKGLGPGLEPI